MKQNTSLATLLQHIAVTQKVLRKADSRLSPHGISFTEFLIMNDLSHAHNKTMRRIDLAEAVGLSASGVTRLLAPMEKINLVEKQSNPRDARVSLVKLTKAGTSIHKDAKLTLGYLAEDVFRQLEKEELADLAKLQAMLET